MKVQDIGSIRSVDVQGKLTEDEAFLYAYIPTARRVARHLSKVFNCPGEESDLVSAGIQGAIEARGELSQVNPTRLRSFVRSRMYSSMLLVLGQIDHFSRSERRVLERLQQTQDILETRLGRSVNTEDLSRLSGFTPERIRKVEARVVETVAIDSVAIETPLESPLHGEDHVSFGGTVAEVLDSEGKDPLAVLLSAENTLLVEQSLDRLPEREYEAVVSSFYDGLTLRQVGDRLGVSEARASQLRTRGLRRMRKFLSLFQ